MQRFGWLALPIVALLVQGLVPACGLERVLTQREPSPNRHTSCVACHRISEPESLGEEPSFAGEIDPSPLCLDCHHYSVNHHPIDVVPGPGYTNKTASSLPLYDGQVRCLTCHRAHTDAGQREFDAPLQLLRGGPYSDRRELCLACHGEDKLSTFNPHRMLSPDGSVLESNGKPVCLICHLKKPDLANSSGEVTFRADIAFLCWRCHTFMSGTFLERHFHVTPRKTTRLAMRKSEKELELVLPLAPDGMITCSTCHNPHQQDAVTRPAAQAGADSPRRLRMEKERICSACHTK